MYILSNEYTIIGVCFATFLANRHKKILHRKKPNFHEIIHVWFFRNFQTRFYRKWRGPQRLTLMTAYRCRSRKGSSKIDPTDTYRLQKSQGFIKDRPYWPQIDSKIARVHRRLTLLTAYRSQKIHVPSGDVSNPLHVSRISQFQFWVRAKGAYIPRFSKKLTLEMIHLVQWDASQLQNLISQNPAYLVEHSFTLVHFCTRHRMFPHSVFFGTRVHLPVIQKSRWSSDF